MRMAFPSTGTLKSSFFTRTEVRRGMSGTVIGGSMLDTWFDMKIYVRVGSSLSKPVVCTRTPVSHTPVEAPHIKTRYMKFTLPTRNDHGMRNSATGINAKAQNVSMMRVRIMSGLPRDCLQATSGHPATSRKCLRNRRWRGWRPHPRGAFLELPVAQYGRHLERCARGDRVSEFVPPVQRYPIVRVPVSPLI